MKYSSRLMTLLMTLILFIAFNGMAFADATGVTLPDGTDIDADDITSSETEAEEAAGDYCTTCFSEFTRNGLDAKFPAGYDCIYEYFASDSVSASAAYDLLMELWAVEDAGGDKYYSVYYYCHQNHVADTTDDVDSVICYDFSCTKWPVLAPGAANHTDVNCPWSKEEYTPQLPTVTASPDVTSPDALKNVTTVTLTAPATGTYVWQKSVYPVSDTSWVAMDGETSSTLVLEIKAETIQYAYRCIITTTADDGTVTTTTTAPLFLGGEEFLAWIYTATGVLNWLKNDTSMEYIIVAYENYLLGIALSEVIYLTNGTLIELEGGTTLALLDENNQLIDVRYKLAVAQVVDGAIVPLN